MTMNITSKQMEITPAIRQHVADRLAKLEKWQTHLINPHIILSKELRRALALCREVAYITLSSFRVNPFFRIFLCNRTGCLCEVIHICRVSGSAL